MPEPKKGRGAGGWAMTMVAFIGASATLLTAVAGFIQVVHPGGMGFSEVSPSPSSTMIPSPSPTSTSTSSATATPKTAPPGVTSPGPVIAGMCVPAATGNVLVTVTSFDPEWNDAIISFPFGGNPIRIKLPTRNVRIGVTVENKGSTSLTLTAGNWRLFDGNPSYSLMSPAPSPAPAYTGRLVSPNTSYKGFVVFSGVPRDITALQLEAKFSGPSLTFKLPTVEQNCSP